MATTGISDSKTAATTTPISNANLVAEFEHSEKIPQSDRIDKEIACYVSDVPLDISPERNKELRRKIDRRVLTIMMATYFLQGLDKGTLASASIMGIVRDTGMQDPNGAPTQQFSWLTTCVYIAILFVQYPQGFAISKLPIAKYLGFSIIAWSIVLGCHAICQNFVGLLVCRTLLGIFESVCQPCFLILSAMWYRREEQAERIAYWFMMSGGQHLVGGLLAYCFSLISHGPLASWQWLFLSYGIISFLFGIVVILWMPDSPMRANCFTEQEKREMVERVRDNQTGIQNRKFKLDQAIEGLLDPQVWGYGLIGLCTSLPSVGLTSFANILIKSFGFDVLQTQLLSMVNGAIVIVVMLGSTWLVKKTNQTLLVMLGFSIIPFAGTIIFMTLPSMTESHRIGLLIAYYLTLSAWAVPTLNLSLISRNIAGQSKKTVSVALNFIIWAAGNAVGPQVFLAKDSPRYFTAFATHIGCYGLLFVILVALRFYLVRQNKKRDHIAATSTGDEGTYAATDRAWGDLTDKENLSFRYVF
ncbi:major facilitator superfamily domain-containing protein [Aspergillus insuetus]